MIIPLVAHLNLMRQSFQILENKSVILEGVED
jgi:hypothetical protein